jgi:MFS family permease
MGIGIQSMVRRVPMMIGPLVGGWLITRFGWTQGVQYALSICILTGLLTMAFQWLMVEPSGVRQSSGTAGPAKPGLTGAREASHVPNVAAPGDGRAPLHLVGGGGVRFSGVIKSFTPSLRELLVSDIMIRFCERIPYAFIVLWAMDHAGLTAQQFGVLVAVEMVTAMFCYIPVAHLADKYGRRPFVLATFVFFALFPVTLIWAHTFGWLAFAFAIRGLKEFGEPARKALIIAEAVPELRARTYGAYYLIRDCIVTTGSFLGAWLWSISPRANFIGAAACGALATIWFWWFIYRED